MTALKKILAIAGVEFDYDKWGVAMSLFFDIAAVLGASDIKGDVTSEVFARWQYRRARTVPSLVTLAVIERNDFNYVQAALAAELLSGYITQQDLIYAGDVLSRYTSLLDKAGLSY